ncbi:nuclear transport factor 2 family protein [Alcaligenaceae bacterium CGII-47]|nr:nuclear transport factor 2 family protein [Alcaligenaceae bacterium CGII-47]
MTFPTPQEAEYAFYEALRLANLDMMMNVWGDDDDIVCIHPGGLRVIGVSAVHDAWRHILNNGPVAAFPVQVSTMAGVMSSVHVLIEQVMIDTPRGKDTINFYATNIYHKGPRGWRMVVHHASPAPKQAEHIDNQNYSGTVH